MHFESDITKKSGRVINKRNKPIGLWWSCDPSGFSAKTAYGDFSGSTLEQLLAQITYAEKIRIEKLEEIKTAIRERRKRLEARKQQSEEEHFFEEKRKRQIEEFSRLSSFYAYLLEEILKPKDFTSSSAVPVFSPRPPMLGR
jgi:hypothetical protein